MEGLGKIYDLRLGKGTTKAQRGKDLKHSTSNTKPQTSNIQHRTSNIEHPTSNIQHPTSNIQHPTSNIEHPTSNIEHRTSNIEHRTSNIPIIHLRFSILHSAFSRRRLRGKKLNSENLRSPLPPPFRRGEEIGSASREVRKLVVSFPLSGHSQPALKLFQLKLSTRIALATCPAFGCCRNRCCTLDLVSPKVGHED